MKKFVSGIVMGLVALLLVPSIVSAKPATWTALVSKFKSSTIIQQLQNDKTVVINDDATKMTIQVTDNASGVTHSVTYSYANDVVSFVTSNTTNDPVKVMLESTLHQELFKAIAEIYGYDAKSFVNWIADSDPSKLSLANDGFEYTVTSINNSGQGIELEMDAVTSFRMNIECGVSAFSNPSTPEPTPTPTPEPTPTPDVPSEQPGTPSEEVTENPTTGLYASLGLLVVGFAGAVALVCSKKKNYFSKI